MSKFAFSNIMECFPNGSTDMKGTVAGTALMQRSWGIDFAGDKPGKELIVLVQYTNGAQRQIPVVL